MDTQKIFKIFHPLGFDIGPNLNSKELSFFEDIKVRNMNTGWIWYDLPVKEIQNKNVIISLGFNNEKLEMIDLALDDAKLYGGPNWSDYDERKEKLRAKDTEIWLKSIGYNIGKYFWGEIWADYDPRSGSGSAGIRFIP